jgi:hypothetical protein
MVDRARFFLILLKLGQMKFSMHTQLHGSQNNGRDTKYIIISAGYVYCRKVLSAHLDWRSCTILFMLKRVQHAKKRSHHKAARTFSTLTASDSSEDLLSIRPSRMASILQRHFAGSLQQAGQAGLPHASMGIKLLIPVAGSQISMMSPKA